MLTLIIKDFKLMFASDRSAAKRALGILLRILFIGILVSVETFLFTAILGKIENYRGAPRAFMVLFLFAVTVFMTVSCVFRAKKIFFDEKDMQQLAIHPVSNSMQVLSKLVFLFLVHYATSFIFVYPLFIAYGTMFSKSMMFYYLGIFYPAAAFIFEAGIALIFVYPVWYLLQYLKKHVLLEFIISVVLLFGMAWAYSAILNVFVGLIANNEISTLFSADSINAIVSFGNNAIPTNFLADIFINGKRATVIRYLCISGGLFMLGLAITIYTFHRVRNMAVNIKPARGKKEHKPTTVNRALIKKELALITRNPDYIYSFSGLLIVQPFLLYLIVMAMNAIFSSGTFLYYTTLFPNFVSVVDVFLVMMVTVIINAGANQYISMEERTIKNLKTIPVSYKRQLFIKVMIPMSLSELSLIISDLVLLITGVFSPLTALFALLLSTALLVVFDFISLSEELKIRHGRPRSSVRSSLFSYLLPIAYVAVSIYLSYVGYELWKLYLAGVGVILVLGLPQIIIVARKMGDWFMELEAIN